MLLLPPGVIQTFCGGFETNFMVVKSYIAGWI